MGLDFYNVEYFVLYILDLELLRDNPFNIICREGHSFHFLFDGTNMIWLKIYFRITELRLGKS